MSPTSCQTAPPRARSTKTVIVADLSLRRQTLPTTFDTDGTSNGPVPGDLHALEEAFRPANLRLKNSPATAARCSGQRAILYDCGWHRKVPCAQAAYSTPAA